MDFGQTAELLARVQFAFTVSFHFIFPAFTIGLVVFAALGQGIKMWFTYDARMKRLEAERRAGAAAHHTPPNLAVSQETAPEQGRSAG